MLNFFVYILECRDTSLYVGSTNNIHTRLHAHNHLKSGARYTAQRRPVRLVYRETYHTLREAKQREYAIKRLTRIQKLQLIQLMTLKHTHRSVERRR